MFGNGDRAASSLSVGEVMWTSQIPGYLVAPPSL